MIPKSVQRFSEKIMLKQAAGWNAAVDKSLPDRSAASASRQ
jgi:hypothetical protein